MRYNLYSYDLYHVDETHKQESFPNMSLQKQLENLRDTHINSIRYAKKENQLFAANADEIMNEFDEVVRHLIDKDKMAEFLLNTSENSSQNKIEDMSEIQCIEAATKIDLFKTSYNREINTQIQTETTVTEYTPSENSNCNSPHRLNNKKTFKKNVYYYQRKIESLRQKQCVTSHSYRATQIKNTNSSQCWSVNIPPCTSCSKRLLPPDFQDWIHFSQCNTNNQSEMEKILSGCVLCSKCCRICTQFS